MKLAIIASPDAEIKYDISKYIHQTNLRHLVLGGEEGIREAVEMWAANNDVPLIYIVPNYLIDEEDADQIARSKIANHADEVIYFNTGNSDWDLAFVKAACEKKGKPLTVHSFLA